MIMKRLITLSLALWALFFSSHNLSAQELSVRYSVRFNTDSPTLFAQSNLPEQMRKSLVYAYRNVVFNYSLVYVDGESELRLIPSKERQEIEFMGQKIDVNASLGEQAKNMTYKNHTTGESLSQVNAFGKVYLITERINSIEFDILPDEKKEILGYECKKAVSKDKKQTVWFSEHIPIAEGPINANVPGLILEAVLEDNIFQAVEILTSVDRKVSAPTEGKRMEREAFKKMVQERVEMLRRGSGNSIFGE